MNKQLTPETMKAEQVKKEILKRSKSNSPTHRFYYLLGANALTSIMMSKEMIGLEDYMIISHAIDDEIDAYLDVKIRRSLS